MDDSPNVIVLGDLDEANVKLPDPGLWEFYKELDQRVIWLDGEVTNDTLEYIKYILRWNQEDKGTPIEQRKPIKIFIHSPGGNLDVADAFCSVIELSKTPIYGYAIGMVASAASLIYVTCHKRYSLRSAYLLLHRGSCSGISGDYAAIQASMDDYKKQIEALESHYLKYTKYSKEELDENLTTDYYVRGDEIIDKGLADVWINDIDEVI